MKRIVTISGKEYNMKSSAFTQFKYKNDTGRSLMADITKLSEIKDIDTNLESIDQLTETLLRIAYVMIEEADKNQVSSYEEFLKGIDGLFDEVDWINEVVELAASPLSRNLQNNNQEK